jgi:endonuclease/exonuclease/phosphatase family metal-dependent hydrolase
LRAFVHGSPPGPALRVLSWNLLRRVGARAEDVAALIRTHKPDLVLLQEATEDLGQLPALVGGHFCRQPMERRIYGLAAWSAEPFAASVALRLPASVMPGRVPPRLAQLVKFRGIHFANVHLSHGQFLNRWQVLHIAEALEGPAAIIGDFNAVGAIPLPGFRDIGPRRRTHRAGNVVALRLDRCMGRLLACDAAQVLEKGASDHHPMLLDLKPGEGVMAQGVVHGLLESLIARRAQKGAKIKSR